MPTSPKFTGSFNITKLNKLLTLDDLATMINAYSINQNKSFESINSHFDDIKSHKSILDSTLVECNKKSNVMKIGFLH